MSDSIGLGETTASDTKVCSDKPRIDSDYTHGLKSGLELIWIEHGASAQIKKDWKVFSDEPRIHLDFGGNAWIENFL